MNTRQVLACLFMIQFGCIAVSDQSSVWEQRIPQLDYDNADPDKVFADIEALSKKVDPEKRGIRIVTRKRPPGSKSASLTLHVADISIKDAVRYVSEVTSTPMIFLYDAACEYGLAFTGPPHYRRTGIIGRVVDEATGAIITNAMLRAFPDPLDASTNRIHYAADGSFVAVVDYMFWNSRHLAEFWLVQPEDYTFDLIVRAPGYEEQKITIDDYEKSDSRDELIIQMQKIQRTAD